MYSCLSCFYDGYLHKPRFYIYYVHKCSVAHPFCDYNQPKGGRESNNPASSACSLLLALVVLRPFFFLLRFFFLLAVESLISASDCGDAARSTTRSSHSATAPPSLHPRWSTPCSDVGEVGIDTVQEEIRWSLRGKDPAGGSINTTSEHAWARWCCCCFCISRCFFKALVRLVLCQRMAFASKSSFLIISLSDWILICSSASIHLASRALIMAW